MTLPAGLPEFDVAVIHVPDLADRRRTALQDQADLAGGQPDLSIPALFGD
jgi:hypothetical protein